MEVRYVFTLLSSKSCSEFPTNPRAKARVCTKASEVSPDMPVPASHLMSVWFQLIVSSISLLPWLCRSHLPALYLTCAAFLPEARFLCLEYSLPRSLLCWLPNFAHILLSHLGLPRSSYLKPQPQASTPDLLGSARILSSFCSSQPILTPVPVSAGYYLPPHQEGSSREEGALFCSLKYLKNLKEFWAYRSHTISISWKS